jgi:Raf kinase inhibitor-like YbhB/YbcL family protein
MAYSAARWLLIAPLALAALAAACGGDSDDSDGDATGDGSPAATTMTIETPAFDDGEPVPERFTCDGDNLSPALSWGGAPDGVETFALIVDDPDAQGIYAHWVVYGIPGDVDSVDEGAGIDAVRLENDARQGVNESGNLGYTGPCPPPETAAHHYDFTVYALDAALELAGGISREALLGQMEGHILAQAKVTGTYGR